MKFAIRSRFKEAVESYVKEDLGISDKIICETIGITEKKLNDILNEQAFPTIDIIAKFLMAYPDIDREWLILGWNDMIREDIENIRNYTINNNHSNNVDVKAKCSERKKELSVQKEHYENLVNSLERTIALQERVITHLKLEIKELQDKLDT